MSGELVAMGWDLLCKVALGRLSMIQDIVHTVIEASFFVYDDYLAWEGDCRGGYLYVNNHLFDVDSCNYP